MKYAFNSRLTRVPQCCLLTPQVSKVAELDKWQLYLVDWGYNTETERKRAEADPRITLLTKEAFLALTM